MAVAGQNPALMPTPPESSDPSLLPAPQILDPIEIAARHSGKRNKPPIQDYQPLAVIEPGGFDAQLRSLQIIDDQKQQAMYVQDRMVAEAKAALDAKKREVTFQDAFLAGANGSNVLAAWFSLMAEGDSARALAPPKEGFKPEDHIQGYEEFASYLLDAESPEDLMLRKARINRQLGANATLALGGGAGVVGAVAGGLADPFTLALMLIPGGWLVKGGRTAESVSRAMGASIAATLPQEKILHDLQPLRTKEETVLNIIGNATVDGALGGVLARLGRGEIEQVKKTVNEHLRMGRGDLGNGQVTAGEVSEMAGGGAAAARPEATGAALKASKGILTMAGVPGTDYNLANLVFWIGAKQSPKGRLLSAESQEMRRTGQMMFEVPMHVDGDYLPAGLETIVKHDRSRYEQNLITLHEVERASGLQQPEFFRQVSDGLRSGMNGRDATNPKVGEAVQMVKKQFDDMWDRAFEARLPGTFIERTDAKTGEKTFEKVEVSTAGGYFTRMYDIPKVRAEPGQFKIAIKEAYERQHAKEVTDHAEAMAVPTRDLGIATQERRAVSAELGKHTPKLESAKAHILTTREQLGIAKMKGDEQMITKLTKRLEEYKAKREKVKANMAPVKTALAEKEAAIEALNKKIADINERMAPGKLPEGSLGWSNFLDGYYNSVINLRAGDHFTGKGLPKPTKMRTNIADSDIRAWLSDDVYTALDTYHNSIMPKTRTAEVFGDWQMKDHMAKLERDHNARRELLVQANKIKEADALDSTFKKNSVDLARSRDIIQHRAYPTGLTPGQETVVSALRTMRAFNVMTKLGMVLASTVPDFARSTLRAAYSGIAGRSVAVNVVRSSSAFFSDMKAGRFTQLGMKLPPETLNRAATAIDYGMVSRVSTFSNDMDGPALSGVERASRQGANLASKTFFLPQLTMGYKSMVAHAFGQDLAGVMESGVTSASQKKFFAHHGINDEMIDRIVAQKQHVRTDDNGIRNPGVENWTDIEAVEAVERAVIKHADTIVVTPTATERPLMTAYGFGGEVGATVTQFMGYNMGALYRLVIPNLQEGLAPSYIEGLAMLAGGFGAYVMRQKMVDPTWQLKTNDEAKMKRLIWDVLDRSGMAFYAVDMARRMERLSGGTVLPGDQLPGRYYARSPADIFAGPTLGAVTEALKAGRGAIAHDPDAMVHSMRMLMPMQNHFLFNLAADAVEKEIARMSGGSGRLAGPPPNR